MRCPGLLDRLASSSTGKRKRDGKKREGKRERGGAALELIFSMVRIGCLAADKRGKRRKKKE